jgi:hypothetical protein
MARVSGGWLVVRSRGDPPLRQTVVELLPDDGGDATAIASGVQVFSSGAGRQAWILDETSHVRPYDPVNHVLGNPVAAPGQLAAVAGGLVVASYSETQVRTRIDVIDRLGNVRRGVRLIESPFIELVAAAGTTLVYRVEDGLHVFDLETGSDRVLTPLRVVSVALSPNGEYLAWVYDDFGPPLGATARAKRVRDVSVQLIGDGAKRVLIADDGTVLFTRGYELRRGRVDTNGSNLVYGYAPDSEAKLALG